MHPLLELANSRPVNQISGFAAETRRLDPGELGDMFRSLETAAPRRRTVGKSYLVGHNGITSSGSHSNRTEEHLAVALFNHHQTGETLSLPDGRTLAILDYQVPLKARRADTGIGKVDLLGTIDRTALAVIELKYLTRTRTGLGEPPLRALLEAVSYTAIVSANLSDITSEVPPSELKHPAMGLEILVIANDGYWDAWATKASAGKWKGPLSGLSTAVSKAINVPIRYLSLRNPALEMGLNGRKPRLTTTPALSPVPGLPG